MTVARMLYANRTMPVNIRMPEKKRTSQTGFSAITVSMKGMAQLFHCQPP